MRLPGLSYDIKTHAVETTVNALTTPEPITELALTEQVGGELAGEGLVTIFSVAKGVYDLGTFAFAYAACKQ